MRKLAPAGRLIRDAVDRIGVAQDVPERVEFPQPVGLAPGLAVEMAAGVAGDLVAFDGGKTDFVEPVSHLLLRLREADIGFSASHARRLIFVARFARQQEDAGQEIGEARSGSRGKCAAAPPLRDIVRAVEGDDDILRFLCPLLRRSGRSDREGCTGGKDDAAGYGHGHPGFGSRRCGYAAIVAAMRWLLAPLRSHDPLPRHARA